MKIQDNNEATMSLHTITGDLNYYSGFDGCVSHEYTFNDYEINFIKQALQKKICKIIDDIFDFDMELLNAEIVEDE